MARARPASATPLPVPPLRPLGTPRRQRVETNRQQAGTRSRSASSRTDVRFCTSAARSHRTARRERSACRLRPQRTGAGTPLAAFHSPRILHLRALPARRPMEKTQATTIVQGARYALECKVRSTLGFAHTCAVVGKTANLPRAVAALSAWWRPAPTPRSASQRVLRFRERSRTALQQIVASQPRWGRLPVAKPRIGASRMQRSARDRPTAQAACSVRRPPQFLDATLRRAAAARPTATRTTGSRRKAVQDSPTAKCVLPSSPKILQKTSLMSVFARSSAPLLVLSLSLSGCFVANPNDINASGTDSTTSGSDTIGTQGLDTTAAPDPSEGETSLATTSSTGEESTVDATTSDVEETTSTSTGEAGDETSAESSSTGGPSGFPNGASCVDDLECLSGRCYVTTLGGRCSECSSDEDCEFGCSPYGFSGKPEYARCNDGSLGSGCQSSDVCVDALECVVTFEIQGVLEGVGGCSDCETDADCANPEVCQPVISPGAATGFRTCVAPGELFAGATCDVGPTGDLACSTGYCGDENASGLFHVGVCSVCGNPDLPNLGCPGGQSCTDAIIPINMPGPITPRLCE